MYYSEILKNEVVCSVIKLCCQLLFALHYILDPEDYTSILQSIIFSPTSDPIVCINVSIANDVISEGPQQFGAVLTTTDNSVALSPEMATIEIDDEDGMLCAYK